MACLSGNISVVEEIGEHFLGKLDTVRAVLEFSARHKLELYIF